MGLSVLIVDDSPAMRVFIRRSLEASGIALERCLEAPDGNAALNALKQCRVDITLSDINMPSMDGEQLVAWLRGHEPTRTVPVIVISTDATERRVRKLIELGASSYVAKPFSPEQLRDQIRLVLGSDHG